MFNVPQKSDSVLLRIYTFTNASFRASHYMKNVSSVLIYFFLIFAYPERVGAMPTVLNELLPDASMVGEGRITFLFWDICDAALYASDGEWDESKPYALTLRYLRKFKGDAIAKRSVKEIRDQGFDDIDTLQRWEEVMRDIFPDVAAGEQITGVLDEAGNTLFFFGDRKIGEVDDKRFGPRFFAIWLGEKTSDPKLRNALIGDKNEEK